MFKNLWLQIFGTPTQLAGSLTIEEQRMRMLRQLCVAFFLLTASNVPIWLLLALWNGQAVFWLIPIVCILTLLGHTGAFFLSFRTNFADYIMVTSAFMGLTIVYVASGAGYDIEWAYLLCIIAAIAVRGWKAGIAWTVVSVVVGIIITATQTLGYYKPFMALEGDIAQIAKYMMALIIPTVIILMLLFVFNNIQNNNRLAVKQSQELAHLSQVLKSQRLASGEVSQHVLNTTDKLNATSLQQADNSNHQMQAIKEVTNTLQEMSATAEQIAHSAFLVQEKAIFMYKAAHRVQETATEAASAGNVSETLVNNSVLSISAVSDLYQELHNNLVNLKTTAKNIRQVLVLIKDIADQTHLLSLNAAIEAAGAGEYGLRFGIVAQEVKALAARSLTAGRSVGELVEQIETAVGSSVEMAGKGQERILEAVEIVRKSVATINSLGDVTHLAALQTAEIAKLSEEVKRSAEEIGIATHQQRNATEQVVVVLTQVNQDAYQTSSSSSELAQTVHVLHALSSRLNNALVDVG